MPKEESSARRGQNTRRALRFHELHLLFNSRAQEMVLVLALVLVVVSAANEEEGSSAREAKKRLEGRRTHFCGDGEGLIYTPFTPTSSFSATPAQTTLPRCLHASKGEGGLDIREASARRDLRGSGKYLASEVASRLGEPIIHGRCGRCDVSLERERGKRGENRAVRAFKARLRTFLGDGGR